VHKATPISQVVLKLSRSLHLSSSFPFTAIKVKLLTLVLNEKFDVFSGFLMVLWSVSTFGIYSFFTTYKETHYRHMIQTLFHIAINAQNIPVVIHGFACSSGPKNISVESQGVRAVPFTTSSAYDVVFRFGHFSDCGRL
jgi:hypothetical protein